MRSADYRSGGTHVDDCLYIAPSLVTASAARVQRCLSPAFAEIKCSRGTVLTYRREPAKFVLALLAGAIERSIPWNNDIICIGVGGPGVLIGAEPALCGIAQAMTITALTPCVLGRVDAQVFLELVETNVELRRAIMMALVIETCESLRAAPYLNSSAMHRTTWLLRELMSKAGVQRADGSCAFELTVTQLATMVGTTRETASRCVSALVTRGILLKEGGLLVAPSGSALYRER